MMHNLRVFQIEPWLWQGGEIKGGQPPVEFTAIVNLRSCMEGGQLPDYEGIGHYIWIPINDADFPGLRWLETAVKLVLALKDAGETVFIHCAAGISRSVMLTAAVLMKEHGWSADKAIDHIGAVNDMAYPNRCFRRGLIEWGEKLNRG
jgi:hypothetical protein